jgi:hypothetical protein
MLAQKATHVRAISQFTHSSHLKSHFQTPRGRTADWVKQVSRLHGDDDDGSQGKAGSASDGSDRHQNQRARSRSRGRPAASGKGAKSLKQGRGARRSGGDGSESEEADEDGSVWRPGHTGKRRQGGAGAVHADDSASQSQHSAGSEGGAGVGAGLGAGSFAGYGGAGAGGGLSVGDASSQRSGSDGQDAMSSVAGDGAGDDGELVADFRCAGWSIGRAGLNSQSLPAAGLPACMLGQPAKPPCRLQQNKTPRRAKRLKRLTRLFLSSTAQSATIRLRERTWLLTFVILAAHLIAFTVLVTQIEGRFRWVTSPLLYCMLCC